MVDKKVFAVLCCSVLSMYGSDKEQGGVRVASPVPDRALSPTYEHVDISRMVEIYGLNPSVFRQLAQEAQRNKPDSPTTKAMFAAITFEDRREATRTEGSE